MASRIAERIAETKSERIELENSIENSDTIIKKMTSVAANRIKNEILQSPKFHRQLGIPRFNNFNEANKWIKENTSKILTLASKKPIKYKAINSPEYRDALIFHEILNKYENIFVDPTLDGGKRYEEFNNDLFAFRKLRGNLWKTFFGDKKRKESYEPWWNENRIMNHLTNEFTGLFDKWEQYQPGLGNLLLWKSMTPRPTAGEFTYFNGKLAPAFKESDMGMVKFGLRFLANADESRISKFQKKMFFDIMTSQYTDWFDFLNNKKIRTKEGMDYRDMYDQSSRDLYDNPSPLIDFGKNKSTDPTMATELNPIVKSMFGADNSYSYGFVMRDPSSAAGLKQRTQHHVFPRGYIPINYKGGDHPRIRGWSDWNKARSGEAYLMLGEALNKKILNFKEQPIIKNTFNEVNFKEEAPLDMENIIKSKAQSVENGFSVEC